MNRLLATHILALSLVGPAGAIENSFEGKGLEQRATLSVSGSKDLEKHPKSNIQEVSSKNLLSTS